jgi:serine/threonine protein phosphatase PrpC
MEMLLASCSDIGTQKKSNQDGYCIRMAESARGRLTMLVVCDGVGGLDGGELASADVIRAFADWFDGELSTRLKRLDMGYVRERWSDILRERNDRIVAYGNALNQQLGTTATALFMTGSMECLILHVGDSRAYRIGRDLTLLTSDHTVAAQAVREGRMSRADALTNRGRSVLTQCVGATPDLTPEFITATASEGELWLLCSDGFRNRISEDEIFRDLAPGGFRDEAALGARVSEMVEICKRRGETDNITVIAMDIQG